MRTALRILAALVLVALVAATAFSSGARSRRPGGPCTRAATPLRCGSRRTPAACRRSGRAPFPTRSSGWATFTRATGSGRWNSSAGSVRAASSEFLGEGLVSTDRFLRTVGFRRAAELTESQLSRRGAGNPRCVRRGRQCVSGRGLRAADRVPDSPRHARAVDARRHSRLGKDDGVGPGRQRARRNPPRPLHRGRGSGARRRAPAPRGLRADDPVRHGLAGAGILGEEPSGAGWGGVTVDWARVDRAFTPLAALGIGAGGNLGSNSWVLAGSRTASGKPILANDPHLGLGTPSVWYLASIDAPGLRATGATLPGVPAVLIGHNDRIAWGVTSLEPDVQDLFVEDVDPNDGSRYRHRGEWKRFEERVERIRVRGGANVELKVRTSVHGPIVTDALGGADRLGAAVALRWTGLDPDPGSTEAFLDIAGARNWPEFLTRRGGDPRLFSQPRLRRRRGPHWLCRRRRDADPAEGRRSPARFRVRRGRLERDPARREPAAGTRSRARIHRHGQQSGDPRRIRIPSA